MATAKRAKHAKSPPPAPTLVVKGLSAAEVAALDAITERRRAVLAEQGGTTSRNATVLQALREFIARHAPKGAAGEG